MSKVENKERLNYKKFDEMSSDDLRAILQADFDASEAECMDVDTIIYISSLLAERKKANLRIQISDVADAKAKFYKEYYPLKDNEGLIKDIIGDVEEVDQNLNEPRKTVFLHNNLYKRVASVVAAILIVLCVGSVTAFAFGVGPIARWNEEHFWFEKQINVTEVVDMLADYGDIQNLVPKWLPDGYEFEDVKTVPYPDGQIIRSCFVKHTDGEDEHIYINYCQGMANTVANYEKTEDDAIIYEKGNIEHYIITNSNNLTIVWLNNGFECSVVGQFTVSEAKKIINSLYGG